MPNTIIENGEILGIMRNGDFIITFSGIKFYPLDPRPEDVRIVDIAHALSNLCRFTGHCNQLYSVAQHCFHVSCHVKPENALWGLLHDASEAYLHDLPTPVKRDPRMAQYRIFEKAVQDCIMTRFNMPLIEPPEVKVADTLVLRTEARDLGLFTSEWKCANIEPLPYKIVPVSPETAKHMFIDRFMELWK